jgi:RNAse (barnase) inhibitor barstar
MKDIKSFILDASEKDFHLEINKKLCPKFKKYGKNYNALCDILYGGFGEFELNESIEITIMNSNKLNKMYKEIFQNSIIEQKHVINFK